MPCTGPHLQAVHLAIVGQAARRKQGDHLCRVATQPLGTPATRKCAQNARRIRAFPMGVKPSVVVWMCGRCGPWRTGVSLAAFQWVPAFRQRCGWGNEQHRTSGRGAQFWRGSSALQATEGWLARRVRGVEATAKCSFVHWRAAWHSPARVKHGPGTGRPGSPEGGVWGTPLAGLHPPCLGRAQRARNLFRLRRASTQRPDSLRLVPRGRHSKRRNWRFVKSQLAWTDAVNGCVSVGVGVTAPPGWRS